MPEATLTDRARSQSLGAYSLYLKGLGACRVMSRAEEKAAFLKKEARLSECLKVLVRMDGFREASEQVMRETMGTDASAFLRSSFEDGPDELAGKLFDGSLNMEGMPDLLERIMQEALASCRGKGVRRLAAASRSLQEARNVIVNANLRLVVYTVRAYKNIGRGMTVEDLIQEGNSGLMRAVDKFDWRRGTKFSTYAVWWIRQGMRRSLSEKDRLVRIPVHVADKVYRAKRAEQVHFVKHGQAMGAAQLGEELGISARKAKTVMDAMRASFYSLDAPVMAEAGTMSWIDTMPDNSAPSPAEELQKKQLAQDLDGLMRFLTPVEKKIVGWRFALEPGTDPLTLQEIADKYKLSRERIRQIEARALQKLRAKSASIRSHLR